MATFKHLRNYQTFEERGQFLGVLVNTTVLVWGFVFYIIIAILSRREVSHRGFD